ncbi:hypothetical protein PUN28_009509 [Cardiocondyla obscurior]|uniref:Uncharacterized protein n=1 Tax=Cardiocondyla obscurior TaxID=286306 RepID=A0AAW2FUV9_9HYME
MNSREKIYMYKALCLTGIQSSSFLPSFAKLRGFAFASNFFDSNRHSRNHSWEFDHEVARVF